LEKEVFPNSKITLTVNDNGATPADGQDLTVLGLGLLSEGGPAPNVLHDVVVPTVSVEITLSDFLVPSYS